MPPASTFAVSITQREVVTLPETANRMLNAPATAPTFSPAPATNKMTGSDPDVTLRFAPETAPVNLPSEAAATAFPHAQPRARRSARKALFLCPLLLAVSGFWWSGNPAIFTQLQAFVTTSPAIAAPPAPPIELPPAPPAAVIAESSLAASEEAVPDLPPVEEPVEGIEAPSDLSVVTPTLPSTRRRSNAQPRRYLALKREAANEQAKPQPMRPVVKDEAQPKSKFQQALASQNPAKPQAILVLEIRGGEKGKKGKSLKELCDKD
ncbi:MAG: hypothetical protein HOP19_14025 [Acidobacteria bacterium]|nr:hypothetical protein [Acidobacteriota bacterium]